MILLHKLNLNRVLGDSLSSHNGYGFTTYDHDVDGNGDGNCAAGIIKAAWWYQNCYWSNLNGLYLRGNHSSRQRGLSWNAWKGDKYALKRSELKIR